MKVSFSPKRVIVILLVLVFVGYVLFQARALVLGPRVWVNTPTDGQIVYEQLVPIQGGSRNIAWIELNGRQIFTDENGAWEEKLLVSDGASIMTVKVRDRFGREVEKSILIYKHNEQKESSDGEEGSGN